jgi:RNA polymerase sigma-70 factor (ECF subfamily)
MPHVLAITARGACPIRQFGDALDRAARSIASRLGDGAGLGSAILRGRPQAQPAVQDARSRTSTDTRTDEELVVAHRSGDAGALRHLMERYSGELHGFLTRLVSSRAGADDVFQEAFLQVHLSAESFDEQRRFRPWLYTIAANKGRDFLRRQKRRAALSLDAPISTNGEGALVDLIPSAAEAPSSPLESGDEAEMVRQVVEELPNHFREILLLAYFQKLSYAQIADSLSIPIGTVKSRLHAAVASFASGWRIACTRRGRGQTSPNPPPNQSSDSKRKDAER